MITYSSIEDVPCKYNVYPPVITDQNESESENDKEYARVVKELALDKISIVDFGGQIGKHYNRLIEHIPSRKIKYTIIEVPKICKIGQKEKPEIIFYSTIAYVPIGSIDVVYCNGGLQYVYDIFDILQKFCQLNPKIILLHRLTVTSLEIKVVIQNFPHSEYKSLTLPYWIVNTNCVIDFMKNNNYYYTTKSLTDGPFRSLEECRKEAQYLNILFKRNNQ